MDCEGICGVKRFRPPAGGKRFASKELAFIQDEKNLLCDNMPLDPSCAIGKILVTGASGYVGGRLVPELMARGHKVRAMVRGPSPACEKNWPGVEMSISDALDMNRVMEALDGIDTAFYLIHSLHLGPKYFRTADIKTAANFRAAAEKMNVKRIIYLGGLGDSNAPLSSHLRSRIEVAKELKSGTVPVTALRAAVIIGSGSASYEIIKHLVQRLPVIPLPVWAKNKCQPISIRDVVKYLVGVCENPETTGLDFDIGGREILSYRQMLEILANVLGKKRIFIPVPTSDTRISAYLTSILTPVPDSITRCLMEGLKNEVVIRNNLIKNYLPFETISYREAVVRAMTREEQDRVHTRWSDAYPPAHELAIKLGEFENVAYTASYSILSKKPAVALFASICKIGGRGGWFRNNWMWNLRGMVDRMLLGVGSSRGRKNILHLEINDVIDFWRIEDIEENSRLLLRAEMKLPGMAWLEFRIDDEIETRKLSITAFYDTHSIFGKAYWYVFMPFHRFIFMDLIEAIEKRS